MSSKCKRQWVNHKQTIFTGTKTETNRFTTTERRTELRTNELRTTNTLQEDVSHPVIHPGPILQKDGAQKMFNTRKSSARRQLFVCKESSNERSLCRHVTAITWSHVACSPETVRTGCRPSALCSTHVPGIRRYCTNAASANPTANGFCLAHLTPKTSGRILLAGKEMYPWCLHKSAVVVKMRNTKAFANSSSRRHQQ